MHYQYPTYQWKHWRETSVIGTSHLYGAASILVLEKVVGWQEYWMWWQVQCACYEYGWGMETRKKCWGWDGLLKLLQEYSSGYMWGVCNCQAFPWLAYLHVAYTDLCHHVYLNVAIERWMKWNVKRQCHIYRLKKLKTMTCLFFNPALLKKRVVLCHVFLPHTILSSHL